MLNLALDTGGPQNHPFVAWQRDDLDIPVFARFAKIAQNQAHHIAVVDDSQDWSYEQLLTLALSVAAQLEHEPAQSPVAVLLPAGGHLAAAFLAALAVGRPYVPLDPSFPAERNRLILEQSGVSHIISHNQYRPLLAQIAHNIDVINIEETIASQQPTQLRGHAASIAYIIYTSGSTGLPKGVYQDQRGLLHDVYQFSHALHINSNDRLTWLYSPSVNGAIRDIYGALLNGATLYAINIRETGLEALGRLVEKSKMTIFHAIPPLLRAFLHSKPSYEWLSTVRLAYISGDRLFTSDVDDFYRYFPRTTIIYNGIGSTECATLYRHWFLHAGTVLTQASVPVGYAIPERDVRLVDAEGCTVAVGEIGEVEVSSEFIAKGYWRNPELTKASFYVDSEKPHVRRFLTGDLARMQPDGLLEYLGRKDGQVKIRGYRVELGAIEAELRRLPQITDAAVLISDTQQEPELMAYIVGQPTNSAELRTLLQLKLPSAAIPTQFYWLDAIPRLANFKTDLAKLRSDLRQDNRVPQEHISLAKPLENGTDKSSLALNISKQGLHLCWNKALRRAGDIDDERSFVDYGGDSLKALTLLVLLEEYCQRSVPIKYIHYEMTVNSLLYSLQSLAQDIEAKKHLYIVAGRQGVFTNLFAFTQGLAANIVAHVVPMPNLDAEFQQPKTISDLGQYVADFIAPQADVDGEIHLLGFSFGARVVSEAGCILQKKGLPVGSIMACDMGPAYGQKQPFLSKPHLLLRMIQGKEQFRLPSIVQRWHVMDKVILEKLSQYLSVYALKNLRSFMRLFYSNDRMAIYESLFLLELAKKKIVLWQPLYFNGTLTVFVAEEGVSTQLFMPKDLGWGAYAANVQVVRLHGGHLDYMQGAGLVTFLEHINAIVGRSIIK